MNLTGQLVRVAEISTGRRSEMFTLMASYYENIDRVTFEGDLNSKEWVIEIADALSDELIGFSTQVVMSARVDGRQIRALFSGDTIVDRDRRGQQRLFQVSGWLLRRLKESCPNDEMYWFLISKGYKTYRFLPLFFREFFPRCDGEVPLRYKAVIDSLATRIDAARYDPQTGILRAGPDACRLRPGVADISPERLRDPHVKFFAKANPGHVRGDELCCLAPVTPANFTPMAYRAMGPEPPAELVLS